MAIRHSVERTTKSISTTRIACENHILFDMAENKNTILSIKYCNKINVTTTLNGDNKAMTDGSMLNWLVFNFTANLRRSYI